MGRWTTTWMPRPKPFIFRFIKNLALGPWIALGIIDDTVHVELPIFNNYHNPPPPPGGWSSLPGYRRFFMRHQQLLRTWDEYGDSGVAPNAGAGQQGFGGVEEEEGLVQVPGPRALWLRMTLGGRSREAGPPRLYGAKAKFDVDRGE